MTRVRIEISSCRTALYRDAITRLRDVEISEKPGDADALITDDPGAIDGSLPTLLDAPETCDVDEIVAEKVMPAHPWRFLPNVAPLHLQLIAGHLGAPGLLRSHYWTPDSADLRAALFAQVDLSHWLFDATPTTTYAAQRPDYAQVHLGYADERMAMIDVATNRPGTDDYFSIHVIGSDGAAYADDHRNTHLVLGEGGTRALVHKRHELVATQNMVAEFVSGSWSLSLDDTKAALATIREVADV